MGKRIVYEKMHSSEKLYRILMIITYLIAAVTVLSCIFTVPNIDTEGTSPVLCAYSVIYGVYDVLLIACAITAWVFFRKTSKEQAAVQSVMLAMAAIFTAVNVKMFIIFFLYGIGKDAKVEELFGTDMEALTESFTSGWMMLILGFAITMLLGILAIIRMASKKYS